MTVDAATTREGAMSLGRVQHVTLCIRDEAESRAFYTGVLGLPEAERELIAKAFVAAAGLQCGFCIPGIALRAKHLLDMSPSPTRATSGTT